MIKKFFLCPLLMHEIGFRVKKGHGMLLNFPIFKEIGLKTSGNVGEIARRVIAIKLRGPFVLNVGLERNEGP
jgi:hypothetical protein